MAFRSPSAGLRKMAGGLVVLVLMLAVTEADASPIGIRSGRLTATSPSAVFSQFSAPDFFVTGQLDSGSFDALDCRPCAPGSIVGASGVVNGTTVEGGRAVVNGVTYGNLRFDVSFQFVTQPVQMPTDPDVTAYLPGFPFQFQGSLRADQVGGDTSPVFAADLFGGGLAYSVFVRSTTADGLNVWSFQSVRYEFDAGTLPEPIPEPATLALVASGIAGTGLRRLRRRANR